MLFQLSDPRIPLKAGDVVETTGGSRIVIDRYVASGGFSLMYIAHHEGSSRYLALKELFPRQLENLLIQRDGDGRIVLSGPAGDQAALWQELRQHFQREAALTRKAGTVYDRTGRPAAQNSPDVLHAEGPFLDLRGNTYLSIDTYQGEPLRDLIQRGFLRDENGDVLSNHFLDEILEILKETAQRLSDLHEAGLWHLDLSPDNIYVVPSAGRTRLTPYIIDYGSAYDCQDPDSAAGHRYTCNPFCAPELTALAQLQDQACGYAPDASSDTYAIASILFYAVTGQVFTAEHRMGVTGWHERIRREYAAGLPAHQGADSFAADLIAFFECSLAAAQRDRLRSAGDLLAALAELRTKYRQYGNLLPLVPQDELMSYMVLEKYPLYRYHSSDGNIHVLCLGSGVFVCRMILSLISCGQMIGSRLFIHVVSDQPEEHLRSFLSRSAPLLERYSNPKAPADQEYVTFSCQQVTDLLDEAVCGEVLDRHAQCRYLLVSLGSNRSNLEAARMYALGLAQRPNPGELPAVLNYYCSEDPCRDPLPQGQILPKWLELDAFGSSLSAYSNIIRTLGLRTLKLAHLYNKLSSPRISLAESARRLSTDDYAQRSSCAAALHLKYKLASLGIHLSPKTTKRAIISAYRKALVDQRFGQLLELEHRRWMMYMIADGYQLSTIAQQDRYGFRMVDGEFNADWRCKAKKLHQCLVPSGTAGVTLKNDDWSAYSTWKEIDDSPFDPLDKVSLKIHLLTRKRCSQLLEKNAIEGHFLNIASDLAFAREAAEDDPDRTAEAIPFQAMAESLKKVQDSICLEARQLSYRGDGGQLSQLQKLFGSWEINIDKEITALRQDLSVFAEYSARRDFKKPDEAIIRHLLWVLYAENDITCIKLRGRTIADNITGPLILEPHRLVYFGVEPQPKWDEFLRSHGLLGEIAYLPHCGDTVEQLTAFLKKTAARQRGGCIIDVTGADEQMVIAAQRTVDSSSKVALIRCTPDGRVENLHRFPTAAAYTLNTTIDAGEIFSLHGASRHPGGSRYMEQLEDLVPDLWDFFREFRSDWNEVTAFFASRGGECPELNAYNIRIDAATIWKPYTQVVDRAKWIALELPAVFRKLTDAGILCELKTEACFTNRLSVSFLYPATAEGHTNSFFRKALDDFFTLRLPTAFAPLRCDIRRKPGGFTVVISNGHRVEIKDRTAVDFPDCRYSNRSPRIPYARVIPALKRLEELHLIADLCVSGDLTQTPVSIRFFYATPALRTCLANAGNILELYIWMQAKATHAFDDVLPNLSFTWREGIDNELDVILTKGLTSLIVSAKTSRFNREHLYEIKYLTEHFSLNSKPVIVYSSDRGKAADQDEMLAVKQRARAMGVYLLDLNDLDRQQESLGRRLAAIAEGTAEL